MAVYLLRKRVDNIGTEASKHVANHFLVVTEQGRQATATTVGYSRADASQKLRAAVLGTQDADGTVVKQGRQFHNIQTQICGTGQQTLECRGDGF